MDSNGLPNGVYSGVNPAMLGLEMSLHDHQEMPTAQNPQNMQNPHHPMVAYNHLDGDYQPQPHQPVKRSNPFGGKAKNQILTLSDDDEPGDNISEDGKRKMSPWQRMKWTDNMVRLLIMVVYYIGDEVGSEGNDPAGKKKGAGVLQKKGKWKSVSRAMMERGFYVSPQQCEDKFNDLNKRYKRVNDILGKGTACKVVENQSLLESINHLSPKMKEEVKKLLNSKHLFFREMCAYHNSCGHSGGGGSGSGGAQSSPAEAVAEPSQPQHKSCLHSSRNAPNLNRMENEGSRMVKGASREDDDEDEDDDDEDEDDEDENDDEEQSRGHVRGHEDDSGERSSRKRPRTSFSSSPSVQQLNTELMIMLEDVTKSPVEKRQWMRVRLMQLDEQRVGIQCQAFELEKQRLKWLKFSTKKERDMEKEKLTNEKLTLENERMVLLIRQKELELLEHHQMQQHSSNKRSDPSSITG